MRIKNIINILIILIFFSIEMALANFWSDWTVQIRILNKHVIPFEPIYVKAMIANNTEKGLPYLIIYGGYSTIDGEELDPYVWIQENYDFKEYDTIKDISSWPKRPAGYKESKIFTISEEYRVDWLKLSYGEHTFCFHWVQGGSSDLKGCDKFYYERPKGIDEEVFNILKENAYDEWDQPGRRKI